MFMPIMIVDFMCLLHWPILPGKMVKHYSGCFLEAFLGEIYI